ncbi:YARHG domain-containing protein [Leptospira stimsonii]|uniref:YARHG domain-containing protein n=1 Tax=Leptospira stimsonii TaxID=2202203 RepID=A0ABY2NEV8_9LEPT|nr:YARHG domain-containing protein [Leptospira stimsonii]TGM22875.1 YARHG domain-containing protein [Leptospira stimsonii]
MNRQFFLLFLLLLSFSLFSQTDNETIEQIILKRNEIYAKQGHIFKNPTLDSYFRKFEWYRPVSKSPKLSKKDQALAETLLQKEKEFSQEYSKYLSNGISWDESKLEYYETVERTFLKNDFVHNQIDKRTGDIPYRSKDIFITGIRTTGKSNDTNLLRTIDLAKSGEIEFKKYYTVALSRDKRFRRILECSMDSINQENCSTKYVLENEKLVFVSQAVPQTSYLSEWIYVYLEGNVYNTRFYFKSMGKVEKEIVINND